MSDKSQARSIKYKLLTAQTRALGKVAEEMATQSEKGRGGAKNRKKTSANNSATTTAPKQNKKLYTPPKKKEKKLYTPTQKKTDIKQKKADDIQRGKDVYDKLMLDRDMATDPLFNPHYNDVKPKELNIGKVPDLEDYLPKDEKPTNFNDIKRAEYDRKKKAADEMFGIIDQTLITPFSDVLENAKERKMNSPAYIAEQTRERIRQEGEQTNASARTNYGDPIAHYQTGEYSGGLNPYEEGGERTVDPNDRPWYQYRKALGIPYEVTDRDYTYDNDFDEYYYWLHEVPEEQQQDTIPGTDITRPHHELVKEKIMNKYGLSEYKFDNRFYEYELDRNHNAALDQVAYNEAYSPEHPVESTVKSFAWSVPSAVEGLVNGVAGLFGVPLATQDDMSALGSTMQKKAIRGSVGQGISEDVAEDLDGKVPDWLNTAASKGASMGYGAGMGFLDQMLYTVLGGQGAAPILMAGGSAAEGNLDALERGIDPRDAATTGAVQGAISYPLNKWGLDEALGAQANSIAGMIGKAAVSEMLEEVVEEGADKIADMFINQDMSEIFHAYNQYLANGMTDEEAWTQVAKDVGFDLAQAGLSGAAFGAVIRTGTGIISGDFKAVNDYKRAMEDAQNADYEAEDEYINALLEKYINDNKVPEIEYPEEITPTDVNSQEVDVPQTPVNTDVAENAGEIPYGDVNSQAGESAPELSPLQDVDFKPSIHNADGQLLDTVKLPEYSADSNVFFNGSDSDIALAESQESAIIDTFRNIISDPEFNALSFKNGRQEVYVSPSTSGDGYRVSYTVDGVPTGHHDYSIDEIDDISRNLREMAGNGGEDLRIQRKSDLAIPTAPVETQTEGDTAPIENVNNQTPEVSVNNTGIETNPTITSEVPKTETPTGKTVTSGRQPVQGQYDTRYGKSRVINNTGRHSGVISDYEYENNPVIAEIERYVKASNEKSFNTALENVKRNGEKLLDSYIKGENRITTDQSVDEAMLLLTNLKDRINRGEDVVAARDLLLARLQMAGTTYGQIIQAFAKWNDTADGAMINADGLDQKNVDRWRKRHKTQRTQNAKIAEKLSNIVSELQNGVAEYDGTRISNGANYNPQTGEYSADATSPRLDKALKEQGNDGTIPQNTRPPKTHEQHRVEVENSIKREMSSVANIFDNNDYEFLTYMVENGVDTETIIDEIEHRLNYGEWYPLDESTPAKRQGSSKLASVLREMGDDSRKSSNRVDKPTKSRADIVWEVANTLSDELASLGLGTQTDVEFLATMVEENIPKWKMEDQIHHRLATGQWYTFDESIPESKPTSGRLARILKRMGDDTRADNQVPDLYPEQIAQRKHNDLVQRVGNTLAGEFAALGLDTNEDISFVTKMLEDGVPDWQIEDEIVHRMTMGEWYEITNEGKPEVEPRLVSAINSLKKEEVESVIPPEPTLDQIRERVRNTLDNESAGTLGGRKDSYSEFTDADVNYLANMIMNGATKEELAALLDKKFATGRFGIDEEVRDFVNQQFEEAEKYDPNSREACVHKVAAYKALADAIGEHGTGFEKFEAWRYLAMLGNPKTWIRNFVGNVGFNVVTGMSNSLATVFESAMDKHHYKKTGEHIDRTKSFLNLASESDRSLISGAFEDSANTRWEEMTGDKYREGNVKNKILNNRSVFKSKGMQGYENVVKAGISDTLAVRAKYSTSLAGWMKANGYDSSVFEQDAGFRELQREGMSRLLTDQEREALEEFKPIHDDLEKGRDYAVKEAEYATFHEQNAIADWINNSSNTAGVIGRTLIEGNVPFKKTTLNIVRSALEYSPVNLINDAYRGIKYLYEHKGKGKDYDDQYTRRKWFGRGEKVINKTTEADLASGWAKTITGSALMMVGYLLADLGTLHLSKDDEKYQDDLEGIQNYSIKIGDKTYTLDWTAPWGMAMFTGAALNNLVKDMSLSSESIVKNASDVVGLINTIIDPIMEMSFLQGLNDTMANTVTSYGESKKSVGGAAGALTATSLANYVSQAIPTVLGQIARTVDPTRRTSDTVRDNSDPFGKAWEKQYRKTLNKIPFASMLNTPYVNARGEEETNSPYENPVANFLYQSLSPSYIKDLDTRESDEMARDVYNSTVTDENGVTRLLKDADAFPEWKSSVKEGDHYFSPEEMYEYRTASGQAAEQIRTALASEEWFNALSGQQQVDILAKVNNLVEKVGKESAGYSQDNKALDIYNNGGVPDLLNYLRSDDMRTDLANNAGIEKNTKYSKAIESQVESGNFDVAEQMVTDAQELHDRGLDKPSAPGVYQQANNTAKKYGVPELSYDEFVDTFNTIDGIDGSDPNGRITQDEVVNWLNDGYYADAVKRHTAENKKSGMSEDDAVKMAREQALEDIMMYWEMYTSGKAKPKIKKDGSLGKK